MTKHILYISSNARILLTSKDTKLKQRERDRFYIAELRMGNREFRFGFAFAVRKIENLKLKI